MGAREKAGNDDLTSIARSTYATIALLREGRGMAVQSDTKKSG